MYKASYIIILLLLCIYCNNPQISEVPGCTNKIACNFDESANLDDGGCELAEENYDCDNNCLVDADCDGVCGGVAVTDDCGVCGGTIFDVDNDGILDGDYDCDGNCIATGDNLDENGLDCLGVCGGNGPVENYDCNGNCIVVIDCAGECGGEAVVDCNGECGGDAVVDCSGECGGSAGAVEDIEPKNSYACIAGGSICDCDGNCFDCAGICGGSSFLDTCGNCEDWPAANSCQDDCKDCDGKCGGDAVVDCNGACGGGAVVDCSGACGGGAVVDCSGACGGSAVEDDCGVCGGDSYLEYELVWQDEFEGNGLDLDKWNIEEWPAGAFNEEEQSYTDEIDNIYLENGNLHIRALRETYDPDENGVADALYTSGRISTKHKGGWQYAKVEVKAQLPLGAGTWPAIWMLPTENSYGDWPASGEIDIMEYVGKDPNRIHSSVHNATYYENLSQSGMQQQQTSSANVDDVVSHIYKMIWTKDRITFKVDENLVLVYDNLGTGFELWPFDQKFHLMLNLAIGGTWGGAVSPEIFPVEFIVDYVKVYQQPCD